MFQNDQTARLTSLVFCLFVAGFVGLPLQRANAQVPGVLYSWSSLESRIGLETSAPKHVCHPGQSRARCAGHHRNEHRCRWKPGIFRWVYTIRDTGAPFSSGCCGGMI